MQVDSRNFQQHVDLILQEIQTAHFISFDCEFTGLVTQTERIEGLFPDHVQFYQRIKQTALNFNLLQLGITLFHFEKGQYFPRSYNFYVSAANRPNWNKIFVSEWQSMQFLSKNNMDFSQVFRYGIPYKRINDKNDQPVINFNPLSDQEINSKVFFSPKDRYQISEIQKIASDKDNQINKIDFKTKRIFDHFRHNYDMSFDKPKKNMQKFEYCCKFYPKHDDFFEEEKKEDMEKYVDVCKKVEDINLEENQLPETVHKKRTLESIIQKIIDCGKPIVGHFPNLDIGLIYYAFIGDLPETFQQFSLHLSQLFPYFFDTKVISRRLQNRIKSIKVDLKSLYKACFSKKTLEPYSNINFQFVEKYLKEQSSHQAGYDSFMTGCAFIAMLNFLYQWKKDQAFVFSKALAENRVLYSRFTGEISLEPEFTPKTKDYNSRIIIFQGQKKDHNWQDLGRKLSEFGTISVYEDHGQTYYVFDDSQKMEQLLLIFKELKSYHKRRIIRARSIFG